MEPIPVGTVVDYHGSYGYGRYEVTECVPLDDAWFSDAERDAMSELGIKIEDVYTDGVAYTIWKEGIERRFGNRMYSISRVRRSSLTVAST